MTQNPRRGDFSEKKSEKFLGGACPRIPLKAYPFVARLGKWSVFMLDPIVYSCFIQPTMFFTLAVSNKSVMKSGRLKYSDISIK